MIAHDILVVLLLITGHWFLFLLYAPLGAWLTYKYDMFWSNVNESCWGGGGILLWLCFRPCSRKGIDNPTPVNQSRHTQRFQPISCRSVMRRPRADPKPGMVSRAYYQPDTAYGEFAVFGIPEKKPGKRHSCYGQCRSDKRYPDRCAGVTFLLFPKQFKAGRL